MNKAKASIPGRILAVFIVIALLAIAQIVWWIIFFIDTAGNQPDYERHIVMLISEGSFFLVLFLIGLVLIYATLIQQVRLRQQLKDFFDGFSHELKTPLASLKLNTETMQVRDLSREQREKLLVMMHQDVDRLELSIENIIDLHRLESLDNILQLRPVEFAPWLAGKLDEMSGAFVDRGLIVSTEFNSRSIVMLDENMFSSVVANLIQNSVRYAGADPRLQVSVRDAAGNVEIEFRDNGIGIPEPELERIFEKFYRLRSENSLKWKGSGLGLFLSREAVVKHGGSITAASGGPGAGTTFRITLPVVKEHESETDSRSRR